MHLLLRSAALLLIGAHLLASLRPSRFTWGFDQLFYFPAWFTITVTGVAVTLCVPVVHSFVSDWIERSIGEPRQRLAAPWKNFTYLGISALSFLPLWLFRSRVHFLGDGYYRLRRLVSGSPPDVTEALDVQVHAAVYRMLGGAGQADAVLSYALVSTVSGCVLVFTFLHFAEILGRGRFQGAILFLLLSTLGTLQLFFGYVESYSLMTVLVSLYLLAGIHCLARGGSLLFPSLFLCLAVPFHLSALSLAPSFLFLVVLVVKRCRGRALLTRLSSALAPVLVFGVLLHPLWRAVLSRFLGAAREAQGGDLLPLIPGDGAPYAAFSLPHLLDFLNEQILVAPAALLLVVVLSVWRRHALPARDPALLFLVTAALPPLLFTFALDSKIGASRDWDLLSLPSIPYAVLTAYLLTVVVKSRDNLVGVGLMLTAVACIHTVPWILVNASESRATRRFETLAATGSVGAQYAYEELGIRARKEGRLGECIVYFRMAVEASPNNARLRAVLAHAYTVKGDLEAAVVHYGEAIALDPNYEEAHIALATVYGNLGDTLRAIRMLRRVVRTNPKRADVYVHLADLYLAERRLASAEQALRLALALEPSHEKAQQMLARIAR